MYQQKQKELLKQYEKQEKKLKELKAGGKSTKQAVSTRLPVTRWSSQQDELAGGTSLHFRGCCEDTRFCLSPFSAGKANKGSPDPEAAEVPPEEPGRGVPGGP